MRYMLLIYRSEADAATMSPEEQGQMYGDYMAFTEDLQRNGQYIASAPLQPVATATTVRVKSGKTIVTDGPFAETREQLGGYYLIEARDLDEAVALAARIPSARSGSVEVRPVMEMAQAR